jgi:hypothetical protein
MDALLGYFNATTDLCYSCYPEKVAHNTRIKLTRQAAVQAERTSSIVPTVTQPV